MNQIKKKPFTKGLQRCKFALGCFLFPNSLILPQLAFFGQTQQSQPGRANRSYANWTGSGSMLSPLLYCFPDKETRHADLCYHINRGMGGGAEDKKLLKFIFSIWC